MKNIRVVLLTMVMSLFTCSLGALQIDTNGAELGRWSSDWSAVKQLVEDDNLPFYIIVAGKTTGCNFSTAANNYTFGRRDFLEWARDDKIPLLYADCVDLNTEPIRSVRSVWPFINSMPTVLIVDASGRGQSLVGSLIWQRSVVNNGIKCDLKVDTFKETYYSYTKSPNPDDDWDISNNPGGGDESYEDATLFDVTNSAEQAHSLINDDVTDWFKLESIEQDRLWCYDIRVNDDYNNPPTIKIYSVGSGVSNSVVIATNTLESLTGKEYFPGSTNSIYYIEISRDSEFEKSKLDYTIDFSLASTNEHSFVVTNQYGSITTNSISEGMELELSFTNQLPEKTSFVRWDVTPEDSDLGVLFESSSTNTVVVMPAHPVAIKAIFGHLFSLLAPSTNTLEFGGVRVESTNSMILNLKNTGNESFSVTNIAFADASIFSLEVIEMPFEIEPYASTNIYVKFTPVAFKEYSDTLIVESDASSNGVHSIACSGVGVDNVQPIIISSSLSGDPEIDEGDSITFTLTAADSDDSDIANRGMSDIVWYVNGEVIVNATTYASGALEISSSFQYSAPGDYSRGVVSKNTLIRCEAKDRLGAIVFKEWIITVVNVKESQEITFDPIEDWSVGDSFFLSAVSSSDFPVSFSYDTNMVTITGSTVTVHSAGNVTITASQAGNVDYNKANPVARSFEVLKALVKIYAVAGQGGGGEVSGSGSYSENQRVTLKASADEGYQFSRWSDGYTRALRRIIVGDESATYTAVFSDIDDESDAPVIKVGVIPEARIGVSYSLPIAFSNSTPKTVRCSNLPSGLRYDSSSEEIAGTPTRAGEYTVRITAISYSRVTVTRDIIINVTELPEWAQGDFSGFRSCNSSSNACDSGSVSMSVSSRGRISGKLALNGDSYRFKASGYTACVASNFVINVDATHRNQEIPLELTVSKIDFGTNAIQHAKCVGTFTNNCDLSDEIVMYRNIWDNDGIGEIIPFPEGYYTANFIPSTNLYGSGYMTVTVDKRRGVRVAGSLADGRSYSSSCELLVDESTNTFFVVYSSPSTYKGGSIFGVIELITLDSDQPYLALRDQNDISWSSYNPKATGVYGEGFDRSLQLKGGWYSSAVELSEYYLNATTPDGEVVPEYKDAAAIAWSPTEQEIDISTNQSGHLTGLIVKGPGEDIEGNDISLSLSLVPATGLFRGRFKMWFDSNGRNVGKSLNVKGVITPTHSAELIGDPLGRGYYLWRDKAVYEDAYGRSRSYSYKPSYDFILK